ncbi:Protein PIN-LIKES 3 [Glycine soja]|uniref:Protein PIN-LIKES 3 isoform D n=1 Tax=Glycine soja TaxID=3848 RepID=A0A445M3F2_GLYSO|nr:Protein PIN-LIKES 3 [Glycine max]KAH1266748.1 Protein PIN-LIKES 3 [Glycine max]RZC30142.1 Protein PIN-LIKES 3 isoform D [Glycine soja]RZC30143.1 Protein PIN-LIKES 3 isoform E [Glycine soja]RZC30144.1 Protein PIN-LIKES 3 isoform F [Glycine soja]
MGLVELFGVASMPVIKVLLITAVGLLLALDNVNLLGKDARIQVNHLVHYVFNPALVGGNLADTITFENVVLLWFMPVNILLTFIIGSALGWILIKLTRAPKHLEGLIMGVCSAGNLGNLPIIIIPAICKDKGSPFGDSNVCYQYGMAYASLSMAVGAVYIWTYVYNIMRVSASVVPKDAYRTSSFRLEASGEFLEFLPEEESSEPENPSKDNMDDYTLLLSSIESEENVKLPVSAKIKHQIGKLLVNSNFRAIFSPATLGAIVGFIVGVVPQIRKLMIGGDASLHVIQDSVTMVGYVCIPKLVFDLKLHKAVGSLKGANTSFWTILGIIVVRYIFLPILGILVIKGATQLGLVQPDPLYQFVLLLQYALPPAMAIGTIAQLFGAGEGECSVIMLWTYALASVAVTFWTTYFMWLVA